MKITVLGLLCLLITTAFAQAPSKPLNEAQKAELLKLVQEAELRQCQLNMAAQRWRQEMQLDDSYRLDIQSQQFTPQTSTTSTTVP